MHRVCSRNPRGKESPSRSESPVFDTFAASRRLQFQAWMEISQRPPAGNPSVEQYARTSVWEARDGPHQVRRWDILRLLQHEIV